MTDGLKVDPNAWAYIPLGKIFDALRLHGVPEDMTLREMQVLNALTQGFLTQVVMTQSELVDVTGLPKSTVARYVWRWLEIGWLNEQIDPQDRRRRLLSLTSFGIQNSLEMTKAIAEIFRHKNL